MKLMGIEEAIKVIAGCSDEDAREIYKIMEEMNCDLDRPPKEIFNADIAVAKRKLKERNERKNLETD